MIILAKLLVKGFGIKFYRISSTFLLYSTILLFGYGIFIKTAGHILDAEQHRYIVFSLLLAFIQTPVFALAVYGLWIFYTVKSWKFIWKESLEPEHLFWRYSSSSMPRYAQFIAWSLYQFYIFIPLLVYWLLVMIYAIAIAEYEALILTTFVITVLILVSAAVYVYRFNDYHYGRGSTSWLLRASRKWVKPLFILPMLEVLLHRKATFLLVKGLSALLFAGSISFLADVDKQWLVAYTMTASIALTQSILTYPIHLFFERNLYFLQQLPITRLMIFGTTIVSTLILVLPELIGLFIFFGSAIAWRAGLILLSGTLLIRLLNYLSGTAAWSYMRYTFIWYAIAMVLLLYDLEVLLAVVQFTIAYGISYVYYFRREAISTK